MSHAWDYYLATGGETNCTRQVHKHRTKCKSIDTHGHKYKQVDFKPRPLAITKSHVTLNSQLFQKLKLSEFRSWPICITQAKNQKHNHQSS